MCLYRKIQSFFAKVNLLTVIFLSSFAVLISSLRFMLVNFLDNQVFEMSNYILFLADFGVVLLLLIIKFEVVFVYVYHDFVGWLLLVFWYTDAIEDSVFEYVLGSRSKIRIKVQHFRENIHKLWVRLIEEFFKG